MKKNDKKIELTIILFIFLFAVLPRFLGAELFVNIDASTYWFARSEKFIKSFLSGDFAGTLAGSGTPGVTLMWLSGGSMLLQNLLFDKEPFDFKSKADLLLAAKLPIILITSLAIVAIFWIIERLSESRKLGLLTVLFLLIDPIFLAHSRFFQLDALMASFSLLSLLFFLLFMKERRRCYLFLSAILFGLGVLTKTPTLILIPTLFIILLLDNYIKKGSSLKVANFLSPLFFWLVVGFLTFFIFFPAFGIIPWQVIKDVLFYGIFRPLTLKHEVPNLLIASPFLEKSYLPLYLFTHLTPLLLLTFFVGMINFLQKLKKKKLKSLDFREKYGFYILLFIAIYFLLMFTANKQGGRYLLPMILALDLFSAFYLYTFVRRINCNNFYRKYFVYAIIVLFFSVQIFSVYTTYPYYSAYRNFIFSFLNRGDLANSNVFSFGWGEGMKEAADYLNQKKNSDNFIIASWYKNSLQVFLNGEAISLDGWQASDYVVLYQNQVHRGLFPKLIKKTLGSKSIKPEKIIKINNYEYAWIYNTEEIIKE